MNMFLTLAFLFFIGSVLGWVLELFFRRFFSGANPERKWINPGFCVGPYVPLYGFGLCILYLIASLNYNKYVLFLIMAVSMTVIEYIAGIVCLRVFKIRLWDYSGMKGNIQGIICPLFSLAWAVLGAVYYFAVHPYILDALRWLSDNLAFSFVIGVFFGVFIIDLVYSAQLVVRLKRFAEENEVIVKYENLKAHIRSWRDKAVKKPQFFFPFRSERDINEHLREMLEQFEKKRINLKRK